MLLLHRFPMPIRLSVALLLLTLLAPTACVGVRMPAPPEGAGLDQAGSGGINRPEHAGKPHVVLVSLDGFKPEYLDRFDLPNLQRAAARGVRARALVPVFPSLTFPNHFSLVTGLHADRHGIVANSFFDPARGQTYSLSNAEAVTDGTWYRGEPIWVTAERQGMLAACYFWPGSEAAIGGIRPTIWNRYDGTVSNEQRVTTVLEWLSRPDAQRPHIVTLYFSELDSASHAGPLDRPEVEQAAQSLDRAVGALLAGIDELPIRDRIYVLLTSDHGMVDTSEEQTVPLASLIDLTSVEVAFGGPVASLHLKDGTRPGEIRDSINARLTHGRAYVRPEVPERHHYRLDPRVGDVVVIMDESWTLSTSTRPSSRSRPPRYATHGWDPALPSMHALFIATGPGLREGEVIPEVNNVDVYPLLTELLGLEPAPDVDGVAGRIRGMLMKPEPAGHITHQRE